MKCVCRVLSAVLVYAALVSSPSFACLEVCVIRSVNSRYGQLVDREGAPLKNALLTIRDASKKAGGPMVRLCSAPKGPVVGSVRTDSLGNFTLPKLRPGDYWLTYRHPTAGESFFLRVEDAPSSELLRLAVDEYSSDACYLVDVERNVTKPPWGNGRALLTPGEKKPRK